VQRAEFDSNPAAFRSSYASKQKELTDKLVAARKLLPDVRASCLLLTVLLMPLD
jgi:Mg-chelatase subunit ChlI